MDCFCAIIHIAILRNIQVSTSALLLHQIYKIFILEPTINANIWNYLVQNPRLTQTPLQNHLIIWTLFRFTPSPSKPLSSTKSFIVWVSPIVYTIIGAMCALPLLQMWPCRVVWPWKFQLPSCRRPAINNQQACSNCQDMHGFSNTLRQICLYWRLWFSEWDIGKCSIILAFTLCSWPGHSPSQQTIWVGVHSTQRAIPVKHAYSGTGMWFLPLNCLKEHSSGDVTSGTNSHGHSIVLGWWEKVWLSSNMFLCKCYNFFSFQCLFPHLPSMTSLFLFCPFVWGDRPVPTCFSIVFFSSCVSPLVLYLHKTVSLLDYFSHSSHVFPTFHQVLRPSP